MAFGRLRLEVGGESAKDEGRKEVKKVRSCDVRKLGCYEKLDAQVPILPSSQIPSIPASRPYNQDHPVNPLNQKQPTTPNKPHSTRNKHSEADSKKGLLGTPIKL